MEIDRHRTESGGATSRPNITMWGTTGSGKTTFLAALDLALGHRGSRWKVVGATPSSAEALDDMAHTLSSRRFFPPASNTPELYNWLLIGDDDQGRVRRVGLELLDLPGDAYHGTRGNFGGLWTRLLDSLEASGGIVYLFDPLREAEEGDAFTGLNRGLQALSHRMLADPRRFPAGRLPHHVAICVTKFDEALVLETAEKMGRVTVDPEDPYRFPRVGEDEAKDFFEDLCAVSPTGDAERVLSSVEKYFHADRVRFFATSSVGFHVHPDRGVFDPDDTQNLIRQPPDAGELRYKIRGRVLPINVAEPMIWLGERLSEDGTSPS
jgi:energy-coupling factor transporter ATP-binding protein EcfA2